MNTINIERMGLAFALTGTILYLGCIILMATLGREGSIQFFNHLLHGLDISSIMRTQIPMWEVLVGILETFILGWLIGACFAAFYNISAKK